VYGQVEGTVTSGPGSAAGGIRVFLNGNRVHEQTTTDANGKFRFRKLVPGIYTVSLQGTGHPRQPPPQQRVEVTANNTVNATLVYVPYVHVPDQGPCCKPYGAPPARRRVV
jgi:hypothetical protein